MELSHGPQTRNGRRRAIARTAAEMQSLRLVGFAETATTLVANGYSPIPIIAATKKPAIRGWSRLCETPLTLDEISEIAAQHPGAGVAVACGYRGLIGIDIDTDDPKVHHAVRRALGEGACSRRGAKGYCSFYRLCDDKPVPTRHFTNLLDVLGAGRCAIIPPSRHPSGANYEWLTAATLFNTRFDQLPLIGQR